MCGYASTQQIQVVGDDVLNNYISLTRNWKGLCTELLLDAV